ncbi:MAG: hypothetical protein NTZ23_05485 [Cyanobium sp. LacPavin_0920_WC12_MAG_63_22]|nr:hypothetical protein [Cyanobium sp. LacPavin_0920_WC12_MAG_63_22]
MVSLDELNAHHCSFIVAPLTTGGHPYLFLYFVGLMAKTATL